MKSTNTYFRHSGITWMILAGMLTMLTACDSTNAMLEPEASSSTDLPAAIATKLELTGQQSQRLKDAIEKREGTPGALWFTAAELQQTLTASQKETLLAGLEDRPMRPMRKRMGRRHNADSLEASGRGFAREKMMADLGLTDDQKEQLETLQTQHREQIKTLVEQRRQGDFDAETIRTQMKAMRESMHASLEQILTPEQLEKLEGNRPQMGEEGRRFGRRTRGQAENRTRATGFDREEVSAAMIEALGLTQAQQEALKQQREASREAVKALREKAREESTDREAVMESFNTLREQQQEEAQAIFTADQLEIIQIHRALTSELRKSRAEKASMQGKRRFRK